MAIAGTVSFVPKGEYNEQTTYKRLNTVRYQNKVYVSLKTVVGVTPSDDKVNWMLFVDTTEIDPSDIAPEFSVAATRENIMTGESLPTLFGKIKKYFTDLKGHAFNDTVKNLTTEDEGSVLDASQGKVLKDEVDEINSNLSASNAGAHNSVYRGKYLGNALTTEQKAQISSGTFNDLYIGDYWTIGGVNYRIAAFDYWLNSGDTNCTTHHVVIVPDTYLYNAQMNTSNVTTGAYVGSAMYTSNLEQAKTTINNAFGSENILSHREYLANATKSTTDPTYESASSWYYSTVDLMNERMVYGADVFHNIEVNGVIPTNYTIDKSQLPLFSLEPSRICNRAAWWMRDVVSAAYFACVDYNGNADNGNASVSRGVRPAFAIKG